MITTQFWSEVYRGLLNEAINFSPESLNERTGHRVKTIRGGESFKLDLSDGLVPIPDFRKFFPATAAVELAWFLSGSRDLAWHEKLSKIWGPFSVDGVVPNSYGYRWRSYFDRDQIGLAVQELQTNPSSRQVLISAWDPGRDGLGFPAKNVPCPTHFTFSIQEEELHSSLFLRSSDLFVGLPYDIMGHTMLMHAFAKSLDVQMGTLHVTLANAHVYDSHWDATYEGLHLHPGTQPEVQGAFMSVSEITRIPDLFIKRIEANAKASAWPEFNPHPELIP